MKSILAVLLVTVFVSCGKNEVVTNVRNAVGKGLKDVVDTGAKAIDDSFKEADRTADALITGTNDAKNTVLENTGNFTESIGKGLEAIGQAPKKGINALLGNDPDSDEKDRSLQNELDGTQEELAELQRQVDELHAEMIASFSEVTLELGELKGEISRVSSESSEADAALSNELEQIHSDILDELNRLDRKDRKALSKIRKLQSKLRQLKSLVRDLRNDIGNLEASCYTYRNYGYYYHYENYRTYCEIYVDGDEREDD